MLANRLKKILDKVVSDSQNAFITNRLITDNALIAFESMHWMRRKSKGETGCAALKLDMRKAYDRIE